jgi:uncharacterized membrane protein
VLILIEVANAKINSFAHVAEQAEVSPSEPIFVLTSSQLQEIISRAVQEAVEPLKAELQDLKDTVALQGEKMAALEATEDFQQQKMDELVVMLQHDQLRLRLETLNREVEQFQVDLSTEIAYDRQRLTRLERTEPQPLQKDRGEILRALLAANGGKMLAKEARKTMHLSRSAFSQLLSTQKNEIKSKPYHLNKSWLVLVLG